MEGILNQYLDQLKSGGKQVYKNLALFPLLSSLSIPLDRDSERNFCILFRD